MIKNLVELEGPVEVEVDGDVVVFDEANERAVINLVTPLVRESILRAYKNNPKWQGMCERELYNELRPSDTDDKMRLLFWKEYNRAQDRGKRMLMGNIYSPVMTHENFRLFLGSDKRVAWMLKPPEEYMISLEAALNRGKDTISKLMSMDLFDSKGKIKRVEASIFLKAYELLDNRVKGSVVQRIEQKTASVHVHKREQLPQGQGDELRKELDELRKKQVDIEVIDVKKTE